MKMCSKLIKISGRLIAKTQISANKKTLILTPTAVDFILFYTARDSNLQCTVTLAFRFCIIPRYTITVLTAVVIKDIAVSHGTCEKDEEEV